MVPTPENLLQRTDLVIELPTNFVALVQAVFFPKCNAGVFLNNN